MTFLPIVERELRVASRRVGTYWGRLLAALLAVIIGTWVILASAQQPPGQTGKALFMGLSMLAFAGSLLIGIRATADCLSEEKREGTLGLLFLTDLKGYGVVLGKLAATSINALYGLLAIFPIFSVTLLLGGVTVDEFERAALTCLNTMFFSLTIGLLASAVSRDERKAMTATFLVMLVFNIGLPVLAEMMAVTNRIPNNEPQFLLVCPAYAYSLGFDLSYRRNPYLFWEAFGLIHALGWTAMFAASLIVPRTWQDKAASPLKSRWRDFCDSWRYGRIAQRRLFRQHLLARSPVLWLAGRDRLKYPLVWGFLGVSGTLWMWGWWANPDEWLDQLNYVFTAVVLHSVLKVWIVSEATRRFAEDRRSGALELLLSTSLTVREILPGQLLAIRRQFLWPAMTVLFVDGLMFWHGLKLNGSEESRGTMFLVFSVGMTIFVLDLVAVSWVGMWLGLKLQRVNPAITGTMVRVLLLPWVILGGIVGLMVLLSEMAGVNLFGFRNNGDDATRLFAWIWFGASLMVGSGFLLHARWNLLYKFRRLASDHGDRAHRFRWWRFRARVGEK